ncbi:MAG: Protein of unknown function (DUF1553)/Protein of unknown function (DUF1549)/Planctomycete [Phycisphaerales bacterium]|nr:Protein of unknown function (DUF1553)/Protein of unknown function (DUF1549)/Planctomycete [Phycisphaerales bacterium]
MSFRPLLLLCVLCASVVNLPAIAAEPPLPATIDFNRDVRPILSDNCFFCHGPDKNKRKADLRLDTKEGLFTPIEKTRLPAVPGHPEQSEIYKRIITPDDDERMPDPKSGKHLTDQEIAVLKKWIEQGAQFKGHWSYIKPTQHLVPSSGLAASAASVSPIDAFLLQKLQQQNLTFSKEAPKETLIRRLYLDLLGLPPTPAQVDAFLNDTSPNAYESQVDQLLANPHFGERMAIYWLDLVRFADTIGYHSDTPRDITPYRDWVINAFNTNMPFDQFTVEQLAGDLLPSATTQQKVASGYNRLLQTTEEGGAQPKEYLAKYDADRVRNYASVWMAATMGCCECHDHKFDPFTAKDFYSMAAFFADVREPGVGKREPGMPVPDDKQATELARLEAQVAATRKTLDTQTPQLSAAQQTWEMSLADYRTADWTPLTVVDVSAQSGAFPKFAADQIISITRTVPDKDVYTVRVKTNLKNITALRLDALTEKVPTKLTPAGRAADGQFVLTGFTATQGDAPIPFAAPTTSNDSPATTLWSTTAEQTKEDHYAVFETKSPIEGGNETLLTITLRFEAGKKHVLGRFKLSATTEPPPIRAIKGKELPKEIVAILKTDRAKRTAAQADKLAAHFRSITPLLDPTRAQLAKNEKSRDDFLKTVPRSLIAVAENPKTIRILPRGNWNTDNGEIVTAAVPHFLPPIGNSQSAIGNKAPRATRLDLATWTVSKENPLTARVVVNRLWKLFYGNGLSKSLEDLGSQGEWPTHPELLDYLACDFQDHNWDVKRTIRQLVTTKAYRQTSYASPELKEIDPFNRLYARQARFRLDAEFVRDNTLSVAGLLTTQIGGPSVKPYQPATHWEFLNFPTRTWVHDKGENEYRRGLYTHWQRSFLHPSLANFDAPSREECTAERPRSNTPQQALTLLNDPTYTEAARVFAQRILTEGGQDLNHRLQFAWRTALSRNPKPEELKVLTALYAKHKSQYTTDPKAAASLASAGEAPATKDLDPIELAAWTSVSRTILNLHETITRN